MLSPAVLPRLRSRSFFRVPASAAVHPQSPRLFELAERWSSARPAELANAQSYLSELADALGVERPRPAGSGFEYNFPISVVGRDGKETKNFIDLFRQGHFLLEAKHTAGAGSNEASMRRAFGQALSYTAHVPGGPPPFLMVLDVARSLLVWDRWSGTYGGFQLARWIDLRSLADRPEDIEFLRAAWEDPGSLDPRRRAAAVTRDVAERLARLSAALEDRGNDAERVARFLIRCVFTMFAEDVGLLRGEPFKEAIERFSGEPEEFAAAMRDLWRAMDVGGRFGMERLLRFNGHFFREQEVLPLSREDLALLRDAAGRDWSDVEPTIFGTLLTRALDPVERHRLGAEYTPREYVERVVRQAVEVPIRDRWAPVLAEVLQLRESGKRKDRETAVSRLRDFHGWLRGLRFLDPACGSGNFLYVTLHTVKRIELEVIREIAELTGNPELGLDEVGPRQFHGIEIKPWAREIAELTLWIGYHQFWKEHHRGVNPPEPVLEDTGTLEQRDAVLAWDQIREVPEKSRPDPTPRIVHPVTGKLVPDPEARLPYFDYVNARQAEWPKADFIVGNPPYMGHARQRESFGDGYVAALRTAYPDVPGTADYVMHWWHRAAAEVAADRAVRAGLITTNTITQVQNRVLISQAEEEGARVIWTVRDHPWTDERGSADVRVTMTVIAAESGQAVLVKVDDTAAVLSEHVVPKLNSDLSIHADVSSSAAVQLLSNVGLASRGFTLFGGGFILSRPEAEHLINLDASHRGVVRPYMHGRDLTARSRDLFVIDFGPSKEEDVKQYPVLYDIVRTRVKIERDANRRETLRKYWWRFGDLRHDLRAATRHLSRYVVTAETAKHRYFAFLDANVAPDNRLVCVAISDAIALGVLSSSIHITWAAGIDAKLEDRSVYAKRECFDSFPFPDPPNHIRDRIGLLAETLDQHRKDALARDERVTMTGMYNVVEKLRENTPLTPKERTIHEIAACGVLRDLHDTLDALVAEAYGWPWPMEKEEILERLVALHDERVEEEKRGHVRWLRPDYQIPRYGRPEDQSAPPELALSEVEKVDAPAETTRPWPPTAVEQLTALQTYVATTPATPAEAAKAHTGAREPLVRRHLETLAMVGEVRARPDGRYEALTEPL